MNPRRPAAFPLAQPGRCAALVFGADEIGARCRNRATRGLEIGTGARCLPCYLADCADRERRDRRAA